MNTLVSTAFFSTIESAGILDVAYPNVNHEYSPPYIEAYVLPAPMQNGGLNIDIQPGVFQCSVVLPLGVGEISGKQYADQIIALFPRNTTLKYSTIEINFPYSGYCSSGFFNEVDGVRINYSIPVSIPFNVLN